MLIRAKSNRKKNAFKGPHKTTTTRLERFRKHFCGSVFRAPTLSAPTVFGWSQRTLRQISACRPASQLMSLAPSNARWSCQMSLSVHLLWVLQDEYFRFCMFSDINILIYSLAQYVVTPNAHKQPVGKIISGFWGGGIQHYRSNYIWTSLWMQFCGWNGEDRRINQFDYCKKPCFFLIWQILYMATLDAMQLLFLVLLKHTNAHFGEFQGKHWCHSQPTNNI